MCVCVAMLERIPGTGGHCLHYHSATEDISARVIGRKLSRTAVPVCVCVCVACLLPFSNTTLTLSLSLPVVQVSFTAVDSGQTVHISDVHKHNRVHFFIPEHKDGTEVRVGWYVRVHAAR